MFVTAEYASHLLTHLQKRFTQDEILRCTMGQGHFIVPKSEDEARALSNLFDRFVEEVLMYFTEKTKTGMHIRFSRPLFQVEITLLSTQVPIWDFEEAWDRPLFFIPISTLLLASSKLNVVFDETTTKCLLSPGEPRSTALKLVGSIF